MKHLVRRWNWWLLELEIEDEIISCTLYTKTEEKYYTLLNKLIENWFWNEIKWHYPLEWLTDKYFGMEYKVMMYKIWNTIDFL